MGFLSTNPNTPNDLSTVVWYDPATGQRTPLTDAQKVTYLQAIGDSTQLAKVQADAAATDAQWKAHPELAKYRDAGYDFNSALILSGKGLGTQGYSDPAYLAQLQANQQANGGATGGLTDPAGVNPFTPPPVQDGPVRGTTVLPQAPPLGGPPAIGGGQGGGGGIDLSQFLSQSPFGKMLLGAPMGMTPQGPPNQGPMLRQPSAVQQGQPAVQWGGGVGNIIQMLMSAFQAMGGKNFTSPQSHVSPPQQQPQGMAPPTQPPPTAAMSAYQSALAAGGFTGVPGQDNSNGANLQYYQNRDPSSQNFSIPPMNVQSQPMAAPDNPYTGASNPYTPTPLASLAEVYPTQTGINQAASTYVGQNSPEVKTQTAQGIQSGGADSKNVMQWFQQILQTLMQGK